jgi:GR25 family glycosyltransferase involved in LPS biosynthesis
LLCASLEDYFKPALNKTACASIQGVDFHYIINLDQRPEKLAFCLEQLEPYGIYPYRFSAVNGWELTLEQIQNLGVIYHPSMKTEIMGTSYLPQEDNRPFHDKIHIPGRTYFCHCMSRGAIGICLSHLSVLQDAYDSGYQTIWIMEDDITVVQNPHILSSLIAQLDLLTREKGWDILFTDQDTKNSKGEYVPCAGYALRPNFTPKNPARFTKKTFIKPFIKTPTRYGAYSMIVRRSGMEKILKFFKRYKIFLPYDMDIFQISNLQTYTVIGDIVSTHIHAASDNGGPFYLLKQN